MLVHQHKLMSATADNSTQLRNFSRRVCWLWRTVLVRRGNVRRSDGIDSILFLAVGFHDPVFRIRILWHASPLRIPGDGVNAHVRYRDS